jgi:Protein of unknown function (DUF2628)
MSDLNDQEVAAFVGTKADYYRQKWQPALNGTGNAGNATGFNWAAFFLSGLWLTYRKMYRAASIFFGIILVETLLEDVVYIGILGKSEAPGALGRFVGLIAAMICGGFGNAWYLSHTQKAIPAVRSQGFTGDAYLQALAKRGGTNIAASLGFLIIFIVIAGVIISLSDMLLKKS